ncbi:MAG: class I SAM-dependent methyltransferase [Candidatus Micrarchaeota archaeon]|nr:class I SAM-dependent methyltransferase [Candidatus Micrarchaeota archaeon]
MASLQLDRNARQCWDNEWRSKNFSTNFASEAISPGLVKGKDVAELFCGSLGYYNGYLDEAKSVTLVDVSRVALGMAQKNMDTLGAKLLRKAGLVNADAVSIPLRDESVDTVLMTEGPQFAGTRFIELFMEAKRISRKHIGFATTHPENLKKYGAKTVDFDLCTLYQSETVGKKAAFSLENIELLMSREYLDMKINSAAFFTMDYFHDGLREDDRHVKARMYVELEKA